MNTAVFRTTNSVTEPLSAPCLGSSRNIFIKRDDLIHPVVSGNKWRKLKYHFSEAKKLNRNHLVTFGGAYSNHMVAVACAAASLGFESSCFVRGDELSGESNHFLNLAQWYGMHLIPTDRTDYRDHKEQLFKTHFGSNDQCFMVQEGGAGIPGEQGVSEILQELDLVPDIVIHASATATTSMGLLRGILQKSDWNSTKILSIAVLKNGEEQRAKIAAINGNDRVEIVEGYEQGGYAKTSPELIEFVKTFVRQTGILIDPVYTGKALFALKEMLEEKKISSEKKVLFLHTGGMLGLFSKKFMDVLNP